MSAWDYGPGNIGDSTSDSFDFTGWIQSGTKTVVDLLGAKNTIQSALNGQQATPTQQRQDAAADTSRSSGLWILAAVAVAYVVMKK